MALVSGRRPIRTSMIKFQGLHETDNLLPYAEAINPELLIDVQCIP